ncbi:hypothetical protein AVEN_184885-1 [Araneus ventricosus]|uniref:Uncharacterized protein n=1 Tax=Araneus ventricosus TaxID=182803 RepID=A0A4Y2GDW0_ARAVE|nr:hypothetical protein AVEN_184885-1 [Araneus ventricosus]
MKIAAYPHHDYHFVELDDRSIYELGRNFHTSYNISQASSNSNKINYSSYRVHKFMIDEDSEKFRVMRAIVIGIIPLSSRYSNSNLSNQNYSSYAVHKITWAKRYTQII